MRITKPLIGIFVLSVIILINSCVNQNKISASTLHKIILNEDIKKLDELLDDDKNSKYIDEEMIYSAYETGNRSLVICLLAHSKIDPNTLMVNSSVKYYDAKPSYSQIPLRFALYFNTDNIPFSILEWYNNTLRNPKSLVIYKVNILNQNAFDEPKNRYTVHIEYGAKDSKGEMTHRTFRFILDGTNYKIIEAKLTMLSINDDIENKVWGINRKKSDV